MTQKKAYVSPQIYRVELRPDQAVLSACSLMTVSAVNGANQWCRSNCKSHSSMNQSDSGARSS